MLLALAVCLGWLPAEPLKAQIFTTLHSFAPPEYGVPVAGLVLSGNTLYGTALFGGSSRSGTVFALNTDGTGFAVLYAFTGGTDGSFPYGGLSLSSGTLSDGANPAAGLILSGNTLYGTAKNGGNSGSGTVYSLNTDGSGFTVLHAFTALSNGSSGTNSDGANPSAELILSNNALFGTTAYGGSAGYGAVFNISLPVSLPQLAITPSAANVILTWPTDATRFTLQSTTNLISSPVWTAVSPAPVVVNGQNTVTNPISGTQQFYRLSQQ